MDVRQMKFGAGLLLLIGLWLVDLYGWAIGGNLIEQGLVVLVLARIIGRNS